MRSAERYLKSRGKDSYNRMVMPPRHTRPGAQMRGPIAPVHRGPQAAHDRTALVPANAPNAALLIDFDNVTMGIRSDLAGELKSLLSSDIVKGRVSIQRAYADWRRYPQYIVPLTEASIDLIFAPAYGSSKKNATDIRLAVDAMELAFTRPDVGTIILLSGDSDFSSLVIKLKEHGKYVIGVGIRESSSDLLVMNCDEYYSYNALAGLVNTREEEVVKWDPWELAGEAVQRMKRNGDVMRADRLKQVMQQIDSSFDEKNLGLPKFTRFVTEAATRGVLSLNKMENGQYEVDLPNKARADGAAPSAAAAEAAMDAEGAEAGEERRPRSRRGRGRGRDRDDRRPRRDGVAAGEGGVALEGVAADAVVADVVPAEVTAESAPAPAPARAPREARPPREPRGERVAQPSVVAEPVAAAAADGIGTSGMRLTRDEAFDLVRRAVQGIATDDAPATASAVRRNARELLGRDSESLSERNFTRILKDAHDADVIDLRRRGDDYEVAPAVTAAPITAQLDAAAAATAPAPAPKAAPAPRGMGPRGAPSTRGRGPAARAALPLDLLSIGVVDDAPVAAPVAAAAALAPAPALAASGATPSVEPAAEQAPAAKQPSRGRKTAAKTGAKTATKAAAKAPAAAARKKTAAKRS